MNNFNGTVLRNISGKLGTSVFILLALVLLSSHDLYLKMESYFLEPGQTATISLYNGTFEKSENIITRDRMLDASMVINGQRSAIQPDQWRDQDSTITQLPFTPNETGTYLVGVSTKARNIELTAEKFNSYLEHDGVLDMLDYRTENDLLDQDAVESYQKHVKAIYQVGNTKTADWKTVLDYPIEFVPQANPYEKHSGDQLEVKLLMDGKTLANQLVYADYLASAHAHGHDHGHDHEDHAHDHGNGAHQHAHDEASGETHSHTSGQQLRTDDRGLITVDLPEEGIYYLRTIYMENVMNDDTLTHRSKWATLTFEIGHQHGDETHSHGEHGHEHPHEHGLPIWAWMLGGVVVLGLLLLLLKRRGA